MRLSKRTVEGLEPGAADYFVWDSELRGFGVRVLTTGRKTYLVQYRAGGRTRRVKLGTHGAITADQARSKAKETFGDIARGDNPAEVIRNERRAPTVAAACDRFLRDHVAVRCKPKTEQEYRRTIETIIKPKLGAHRLGDVMRADIAKLHHELRETPYQANRVLSVLSKLFNCCELWGLRAEGMNPCRLGVTQGLSDRKIFELLPDLCADGARRRRDADEVRFADAVQRARRKLHFVSMPGRR